MKKIVIIIFLFVILFLIYSYGDIYNFKLNNTNNDDKISKKIDMTLVGDLLFEQPFYDAVDNGYDKNNYFKYVKDYFENDDISIGNMEVVIGNDKLKTSGTGYNFCAPSYIGDLISTLSFEVLGTANNHTYDRGIDGINSTLNYFENKNIMTVGTYKDEDDRSKKIIIDKNGIKVGFLAYTYGTNQKISDEYINNVGLLNDKSILKEEITKLKNDVDVVVVIMHWGVEFTFKYNKEQEDLASYLNELGVDIILGSHSHSIQPVKVIGDSHKTLVYYSLGNFTSQDDDIARTAPGNETFDNAYQFGLLSKLSIEKNDNGIFLKLNDIEIIVNYFDKDLNNFLLIPLSKYDEEYEKSHYRYDYGLTREFIEKTYKEVIADNIDVNLEMSISK